MNDHECIASFILGFAFGVFLAGMICISTYVKKSEAIEHGAAQYNAQTGDFEWKVEE